MSALAARVEATIRRHELISPGGGIPGLFCGGAASACRAHVLRELGYAVRAVHVDHGLRGEESAADAAFCRDVLGADVLDCHGGAQDASEAQLRAIRYEATASFGLRATGHTASDQVET